ncbi:uncharacterized protein LOC129939426 [Eupeodes corollae]|uniref:uncharacterized protein LOC129939426 n=1 Tax=Eupeodes corollae TaxID=290404 RepID=UPI002490CA7E|nr:uncharacterized protein LOC129939426 [Eupeodes corollae]
MSTGNTTVVEQKCPLCNQIYTDNDMVECTKCRKWIHYVCANVGDEVANDKDWKCSICTTHPTSDKNGASSNKSGQSKRIQEKLRLMEEEDHSNSSGESERKNSTAQQDKVKLNPLDEPCGKSVLNKYLTQLPQPKYFHVSAKPTPLYESNVLDECMKLTDQQIATRHAIPRDLPVFTGHPGEWPVFISTFTQTTAACGFTKTENLLRLQRCLKGKAREVVVAQLTIPNCVPIIISTLRRYFGQPEIILDHYIDRIKKMTSPKLEKLETVLDYAVAVTNLCATLEQADLQAHMRDPNLMRTLVEKLPPTLQLSWASHRREEEDCNNICILGDWLHSLAGDICDVMPSKNWFHSTSKTKFKNEHVNIHDQKDTRRSKAISTSNFQRKCSVCQGCCQSNSSCKKFMDWSVNQRWDFVKQAKLCRQCLKRHPYRCTTPVMCSQDNCHGRHHPLLHNALHKQEHNEVSNEGNMNHITPVSVKFRILPVVLFNNEKQVRTFAFLDEGSSSTLLNERLAKELQLEGETAPLCLKWSGTISRQEKQSLKTSLTIAGDYQNAPRFNLSNVRTVQNLNLPSQSLDYKRMATKFHHLRGLPVESYANVSPGILIGLKNWHVAVPLKVREATEIDPIAVKCRLGWTVFSVTPDRNDTTETEHHCHQCECQPDDKLHQLVKDFFATDSLGTLGEKDPKIIQEEEKALSLLNEKTIPSKGRYESGLLWRYENIKLPDSKPMAMSRMRCLEKRLYGDEELKKNMIQQIKDYEKKGYIRKLTKEECERQQEKIWYLPIFPIRNPNKPGKIRIVWDAAATVNGVSLNTLLMKGVDWNSSLLGVLLRSRERKIGLSADIKEMYHQVKIPPEDQNVLRFLWREDVNSQFETYVMQVMTFGATCSPSCAQYVKNHNALQFAEEFPRAVESIVKNHYVDDLLDSVDKEQEAVQLAKQISEIHSRAGFEIRNWRSNNTKVMEILNPESPNDPKDLNMNPECFTEKILGMWWCLQSDTFTFSLRYNKGSKQVLSGECRPTKREVLKILMSIYDPLGLIANFLVYLKILLQDIWRSQIHWDEKISDDQFEAWTKWLQILPQVEQLRIPRCLLNQFPDWEKADVQLHILMDASEQACATVAYLRISKDGKVECSLLGAKTKVAPIKLRSIPRLELDAAVMGCRFGTQILKELSIKVNQMFFWSDSKTVLVWIKSNPHRYNKYIAFRVAEIQDIPHMHSWRYIPSKLNIADEATKWTKPPKLDTNDRWFQGPEFLKYEEDRWPKDKTIKEDTSHSEELLNIHVTQHPIIDFNRFSKWSAIVRTIAYVIRYLNIKIKFKSELPTKGILNGDELNEAQIILFRQVQENAFSEEICSLMKEVNNSSNAGRPTVHSSSKIRRLCPYLDNQRLLRAKGRLEAVSIMSSDQKHPIILPRGHHATNLIILQCHERFLHANNETVVNQLRQQYAIPKLRSPRTTKRDLFRSRVNFIGAERQLRQDLEAIDPAMIAKQFISPSLKWNFNPPAAPHMGGAWERLVRSFKTALYTSLPLRTPSDPLLRSCLISAENIINSRPLTYVPVDNESSEALTPNHFLRLDSGGGKPTMKLDDSWKTLKQTYQYKEQFANKCWKRFITEYLPELTLRSKWYDPVQPLKIGDIVVLIDKDLPRNNYPKGRIIAVKTSSDGQVRSATIQTSNGIFERPTVKLALLQLYNKETTTS